MPNFLLDSGIVIRHLRKAPGYRELVRGLALKGSVAISVITRIEVIRGMRDSERDITFSLLNSFNTFFLDTRVADLAGELIRFWRKKGFQLDSADAVIAGSGILHDSDLITTNARHFPMPELIVWQADEKGSLKSR